MSTRILCTIALIFALPLGGANAAEFSPLPVRPARVVLKSDLGELAIKLDWDNAPENSETFVRYVREGIYTGTSFDGIDEYCLYGGEPAGARGSIGANGNMICTAGPPGEFKLPHHPGAVGFRRTAGSCNPDKRSNCTLIYIMLADHPQADGEFTVFGALEADPAVLEAITAKMRAHVPVPYTMEFRE